MPKTSILFYQEEGGRSALIDWLHELRKTNRKAFAQCIGRISQLQNEGYELRRPSKEQSAVPDREIEQAIERKRKFIENPETHTYQGEL